MKDDESLSQHANTARSFTTDMVNLFDPVGQTENEYEDCGTTKGCFGQPENCIAAENCKVIIVTNSNFKSL